MRPAGTAQEQQQGPDKTRKLPACPSLNAATCNRLHAGPGSRSNLRWTSSTVIGLLICYQPLIRHLDTGARFKNANTPIQAPTK